MPNFPLVSVLIPLYNKKAYIAQTLESVINQTYSNIEIIIVDDGSTDGSLDIAQSYRSAKIKVYTQLHEGACAARNKAFDLSNGDYIQYLDADDLLDKSKIAIQVKCLSENPPNTLTTAKRYFFTRHLENAWQDARLTLLEKDYADMERFLLDEVPDSIYPFSWLIPRHLVAQAGLWDTQISIYDDRDFYLRLVPLASKILHCPDAIGYYRLQEDENRLSAQRNLAHLKGALRYFSKFKKYFTDRNSKHCDEAQLALACLYKKLLMASLNNKIILSELKQLCFDNNILPHCKNQRQFIKVIKALLGISMGFNFVVFMSKKISNQ